MNPVQELPASDESARRWDETFARTPAVLSMLEKEAMAEIDAGETQDLDLDAL